MWDLLHESDDNTIVAIHNHPNSATVSIDDIARCFERQYKYGLVFCHSGIIYKYYTNKEYDSDRYYAVQAQLEKIDRAMYNKVGRIDEGKLDSALDNLREKGVILEVIL